jgi:Calcineurin-like phosphoesterase
MKQNHYDIIGDIHGHADTLRALLAKLGYAERDGAYRHPERRVIFVGDFIDRGPKIRETLRLVRAMVESGNALAVLGNHEFNAIRYHTNGSDGKPLRPHSDKNVQQHRATLDQLAAPHPEEWADWLAWFKTLPLFLDLGGVRVVHAAWRRESVRIVADRRFDDEAFLLTASTPGHADFEAVSTLLNGPEMALPEGQCFHDKEGHARTEIRVRWFGPRTGGRPATYRSMVFPPSDEMPETPMSAEALAAAPSYGEAEPPVIFGHYWMPPVSPRCLAPNAVCVDYSVASKNGGFLTAYRWSGEAVLSDANLVTEVRV